MISVIAEAGAFWWQENCVGSVTTQPRKFKGEPEAKFSGNNEGTFESFDAKTWSATVRQLDEVMTELERVVENADENQVKVWASEIAHIGTHNAYHIGQIVYIRRLQGSWDAEKGVK